MEQFIFPDTGKYNNSEDLDLIPVKEQRCCPKCGSFDLTHSKTKVKCNDCGWTGNKNDLSDMNDELFLLEKSYNYDKNYMVIGKNALNFFVNDEKHFFKYTKSMLEDKLRYVISENDKRKIICLGQWNPTWNILKKRDNKKLNIEFMKKAVESVCIYMLEDEWNIWKLENPLKWENWKGNLE